MNCICCGNASLTDLKYKDQFVGRYLKNCCKCGHIQLAEHPTAERIAQYYNDQYGMKRKQQLNNDYFRVMEKRAKAQTRFIEEVISLDKIREAVDIGCGYGRLLSCLNRSYGIYTTGYEMDPEAYEYCKNQGLNIARITDEGELLNIPYCDLAILSHVLEHLINPAEALEKVSGKARFIFIEIPLYRNALREQFIDQEGHLSFFTSQSIIEFIKICKLDIINYSICGPNIDFWWANDFVRRNIKRVLRVFINDTFWNQYERRSSNGMWGRLLVTRK